MKILKLILKNKFFGFILGIFISLFFIKLFIYKKKNNLKIIVFSEHRWRDSLKIINKDKNICLIKIFRLFCISKGIAFIIIVFLLFTSLIFIYSQLLTKNQILIFLC